MIVNIEKWICQSCQMYLSRLQNYLFDPRIRTVLQRWGNAFQGAPCHDGEDPWTFPWLVSLLPDDILNLFTNFLPRQNVSTNEDKILPSGQACLGRAQLRRQICERKLQIAQGSSTTMIIPVSSVLGCRSTSNLTKRSTSSCLVWSKPCSLTIPLRGSALTRFWGERKILSSKFSFQCLVPHF